MEKLKIEQFINKDKNLVITELFEKVNEIVEWINDHKDQLLNRTHTKANDGQKK